MTIRTFILFILVTMVTLPLTQAFSLHLKPNSSARKHRFVVGPNPTSKTSKEFAIVTTIPSSTLRSSQKNDEDVIGLNNGANLDLVFAAAWIGLVFFAFFLAPGGVNGPESMDLLEKILANPVNPGINGVFNFVFGLFSFIPFSLAGLIMPSAKGQKFPATPVLIAASFVGYFVLGPYMATRKPVTTVNESDLGWFTANVLENKLVSWIVVGLSLSSIFTSGFYDGITSDMTGETQGFVNLLSTTAIASVSSLDLVLLCISAAVLVPEDLQRRGFEDKNKANAIAAFTLLFPVVGSVLYCALRPKLLSEQNQKEIF